MLHRLRARLSYANVMATIAVFIALGGTSYAAINLPRNSVGASEIRTGAVRSSEIKDRSIRTSDLATSARNVAPRPGRRAGSRRTARRDRRARTGRPDLLGSRRLRRRSRTRQRDRRATTTPTPASTASGSAAT